MKASYITATSFVITAAIGAALSTLVPRYILANTPAYSIYIPPIQALFILCFGYLAIRMLAQSIISYGKHKARMDEKSVAKIVTLLSYAILIILVMLVFKINLTGILVGAGFLGIVIGLASQSTLGNFFAGVSMMAAKPFATGDRVTFSTWQYGMMPPSYSHHAMLPGYSGMIEDIGIMYTRIKLDEGPQIFVPNSIINQAAIINYSVSDIKDVIIRAELDKKKFRDFKSEMVKKVNANTKLSKIIGKSLRIQINDIGISNYGIRITASAPVEEESYVFDRLSEMTLRVSKGL